MTHPIWFGPVLAHLWDSTAFAVLAISLILVLRRAAPALRQLLASSVLIKFLVPTAALTTVFEALWPRSAGDSVVPITAQWIAPAAAAMAPPPPPTGSAWPLLMVAVAVVSFAWAAIELLRLVRSYGILEGSLEPASSRERELLARATAKLELPRPIRIARSELVLVPAAAALREPTILLPTGGLDGLDDARAESVLLHECAHHEGRDPWRAAADDLLCRLFWFHPLVWFARHLARRAAEERCDARVLGHSRRADYLAALHAFALGPAARTTSLVTTPFTSHLRERIPMITTMHALRSPSPWRGTWVALALLAGFCTTVAWARRPAETTERFSVRATMRGTDLVEVEVVDRPADRTIAAARVTLGSERSATTTSTVEQLSTSITIAPSSHPQRRPDELTVAVEVREAAQVVHEATLIVTPTDAAAARKSATTGEPITLSLSNADLATVLQVFARLSGRQFEVDPTIRTNVSVSWTNVPWEEALAALLAEHSLEAVEAGGAVHVRPRTAAD